MNIVIPAAGAGKRFVEAGYSTPKPFIEINGKPMIQMVIDNISEPTDMVYVLMRTDHLQHAKGTELSKRDNVSFIMVDELTDGAACTVLKARGFIDNTTPLVIANSDQYVDYDRQAWRDKISACNGAIMTFYSNETKWSYAQTDDCGKIIRVAEKEVISEQATVGIYYFEMGNMFVDGAKSMMEKNIRVNEEFYVCPVYNELVQTYNMCTFEVSNMYGLGTPEDFENNHRRISH